MIVKELFAKIGLDVEEDDLHKVEAFFSSTKVKVAAFAGAVAGIGLAFVEMAKKTAEAGEEVDRNAQKVGVTTDALQELQFAAEESGASAEGMTSALFRMSRAAYEAKQGSSEAAQAFQGLLTLKDLKDLAPDQMFMKLADGLSRTKDVGKRNNQVMQIFGREMGSQLVPLLNRGREGLEELRAKAHEFGVVLDQDTIKNAKEFNERQREMAARLKGIAYTIGSKVLGALLGLTHWWEAFRRQHPELVFQTIKFAVLAAATALGAFVVANAGAAAAAVVAAGSAAAAWLVAAAPFVLIAGAVAFLLLVLEDLYQYMTGGESVIGDFFGEFQKSAKTGLAGFVENVKILMKEMWDAIIHDAGEAGMRMAGSLFRGWAQIATGLVTGDGSALLGGVADIAGHVASTGGAGITGGGSSPSMSGSLNGLISQAMNGGGGVVVHAPVHMEVHAAPGMDETKLADQITRKIDEHHAKVARDVLHGSP